MKTSSQRVRVYIDGPYLRLLQRRLDWSISYSALLDKAVDGRNLLEAVYYFGYAKDSNANLISLLRSSGYRVNCIKLNEADASDALHEQQRRGGVLVPLVIDAMESASASSVDAVVICSSNRELAPLLSKFNERKVPVELLGVPGEIPPEFRQQYSRLINISQYRNELEFRDGRENS